MNGSAKNVRNKQRRDWLRKYANATVKLQNELPHLIPDRYVSRAERQRRKQREQERATDHANDGTDRTGT